MKNDEIRMTNQSGRHLNSLVIRASSFVICVCGPFLPLHFGSHGAADYIQRVRVRGCAVDRASTH